MIISSWIYGECFVVIAAPDDLSTTVAPTEVDTSTTTLTSIIPIETDTPTETTISPSSILIDIIPTHSDPTITETTPWATQNPECVDKTGEKGSSLTYCVDTTGSMWDDMYQLKIVNRWLLDRIIARFPCGVRKYTMVEFNDPTVGPVRTTASKNEFAYFFDSLYANGGGDCPELAMAGLKLALENSPDKSFILVLTDASALDYNDVALVNEIYRLLDTTRSQVFFVITGLCGGTNDPDFLIYREIASRSFGHVFIVGAANLNIVFHYLDFTLSIPVNSSEKLFSKNYEDESASDSFPVSDNFTSLVVTTDGAISSFDIRGPDTTGDDIKKSINESWGSMYTIKDPAVGNWTIDVTGSGKYSVRVEGFYATNISTTSNCSACHPNATCEDTFGYLECSCKDGFIGDGFDCSDIDECAYSWSNKCGYFTCVNTFGSYTCQCPSGYYNYSGDGCVDIDECSSSDLNSCSPNATCINSIGSYTCVCSPGYFGNGYSCEVDECALGVCGSGVECIKYFGSYSCFDPCLSYTTLDEPWRSTANMYSYSYYYYPYSPYYYPHYYYSWYCDYDKNGWYRFVGIGGVKMPESCVSMNSCGTSAPMWLQGSHPLIDDGVVTRTACANWYGSCCYWSTSVQIKQCPDKYYVYKFSGAPSCNLAYCTDPSSIADLCACAATEKCTFVDGKYGCECKDEYKIYDISALRPTLTCGPREMKASFLKCQLKSQNIDVSNITIENAGCYELRDDIVNGTYSIVASLTDGECGVQLIKYASYATYFTTVNMTLGPSDSLTLNELNVEMKCSYPLDMQLSLETAINPVITSLTITTEGTGQFKMSMALFNDSTYTVPYEGPEVRLSNKAFLYVGVILDGPPNSPYVVVLKNCFGTPRSYIYDYARYDIIRDSCPNRQDSSISVPINGQSTEARFSLQLLKFMTGYKQIYLHCEITLCDKTASDCNPVCSDARGGKVNSDGQSYNITLGPITTLLNISDIQASSSGNAGTPCFFHLLPTIFIFGRFLMAYA